MKLGSFGSHMVVGMGFDVRKCYTNKSGLDGLVTTGRFVCSNQGSRAENKKYCVGKRNRAHTRTCCMVRMGITLDRENMTYKVHDYLLTTTTFFRLHKQAI